MSEKKKTAPTPQSIEEKETRLNSTKCAVNLSHKLFTKIHSKEKCNYSSQCWIWRHSSSSSFFLSLSFAIVFIDIAMWRAFNVMEQWRRQISKVVSYNHISRPSSSSSSSSLPLPHRKTNKFVLQFKSIDMITQKIHLFLFHSLQKKVTIVK